MEETERRSRSAAKRTNCLISEEVRMERCRGQVFSDIPIGEVRSS